MAIKDTFNKMISYFDTDGVNEVEEEQQMQLKKLLQDHSSQ